MVLRLSIHGVSRVQFRSLSRLYTLTTAEIDDYYMARLGHEHMEALSNTRKLNKLKTKVISIISPESVYCLIV